ncbi:hypothetical protein H1C71_023150, partial [Ictidomys tridecemlineatus]
RKPVTGRVSSHSSLNFQAGGSGQGCPPRPGRPDPGHLRAIVCWPPRPVSSPTRPTRPRRQVAERGSGLTCKRKAEPVCEPGTQGAREAQILRVHGRPLADRVRLPREAVSAGRPR